jgi:DNA-binding protein WhiA
MAMTAAVKDELSRLTVTRPCCRKAEVSATLRFAGGLHIVAGRIVIEAELDTGAAARRPAPRHRRGLRPHVRPAVVAPGGLRKGNRYVVRVVKDGEALARQTGLIDGRGPTGPRLAAAGRLGVDVRRRSSMARRVRRPRVAHRAGPFVVAGDHLPGS